MDYRDVRKEVENMINNNYNDFVKAVVGIELGINDEKGLVLIYDKFMENDSAGLLNENFDYIVDELKEQGKIIDNQAELSENKNLVNIIGNISGEIEKTEISSGVNVCNFSVVSKNDAGDKVYNNCSAYGNKAKDVENLKQGDFVKIFGEEKPYIDNNGKERKNIRVLSAILLKAKELDNEKPKKESVLGKIADYKKEEKEQSKPKADKGIDR
nr:DNA-binding protein [uncultured Criibacterium sp.]